MVDYCSAVFTTPLLTPTSMIHTGDISTPASSASRSPLFPSILFYSIHIFQSVFIFLAQIPCICIICFDDTDHGVILETWQTSAIKARATFFPLDCLGFCLVFREDQRVIKCILGRQDALLIIVGSGSLSLSFMISIH